MVHPHHHPHRRPHHHPHRHHHRHRHHHHPLPPHFWFFHLPPHLHEIIRFHVAGTFLLPTH